MQTLQFAFKRFTLQIPGEVLLFSAHETLPALDLVLDVTCNRFPRPAWGGETFLSEYTESGVQAKVRVESVRTIVVFAKNKLQTLPIGAASLLSPGH